MTGTVPEGYDRTVAVVWEQVVVNARDPLALGRWWAQALQWEWFDVDEQEREMEIRASADALPGLYFVGVPEEKAGPNRLHLDLRPDDQEAEVERLLALGATRADVGQGEQSWVVLADPEGNELCVLRSRS